MSNNWAFNLRGEGTDTLELDIYDVIGEGWFFDGVTAKNVRSKLRAAGDVKLIKVRINSGGGDVFDGLAIYNLLAQHSARVEVDIDGLAASMASVIAMAGDEVRMGASAFMMIHNPWTVAVGESSEMREAADLLDKMQGSLADAYVARTGIAKDDVLAMMNAETWFSSAEAVAKGFADKVVSTKKAQKKAAATAFAALRIEDCLNAPDQVRELSVAARSELKAPGSQTEPAAPVDSDESALIKLAHSDDPKRSLAAIAMLDFKALQALSIDPNKTISARAQTELSARSKRGLSEFQKPPVRRLADFATRSPR